MKKRFKRIMTIVVTAAMLCGTIHPASSSVGAKIIETERTLKGKKLTYYTDDKFLYSLKDGNAIIWGYLGDGETKVKIDTLKIPSKVDGYPVIKIGKYAFDDNCSVKEDGTRVPESFYFDKVIIPKEVKTIQTYAFSGTEIKQVVLSDGIKKIGDGVFSGCKEISNIKLPESLEEIGAWAFEFSNIRKITIPSKCTEIQESTFSYCTKLKKVKLHENIGAIHDRAFSNCYSLTELEIPDNVNDFGVGIIESTKKKTKIIFRPMNAYMDSLSFLGFNTEYWIYPGSDAEKYFNSKDVHYMKPDISTKKLKVKKGEATPLVMYGARKKVKWHIEDESVVKLVHYGGKDRNVTVKGKKKGSTAVTATYKGKAYNCKVVVK